MLEPIAEQIDALADAFEEECRAGTPPEMEAYLKRVDVKDRCSLLTELVKLDLEYRLRASEQRRVEQYLSQHPSLSDRAETIVDLIALEYRVRQDRAERVAVAEFLERFPELRDRLLAVLPPLRRVLAEVPGYELREEVGRGGMGVVYRAIDVEFGRPVAVKLMLPPKYDAAEAIERFLDETRITGCLQHPGVPPVHRCGTLIDGRPYLVMKLIEGGTLSQLLCDKSGSVSERQWALWVFEKICQTVAYAHGQEVVHRDLKPQNVMVGSFGEVQVMDWGLAKDLRRPGAEADAENVGTASTLSRQTREGCALGTPAYMAPEQARGELSRVGKASDVFSLGAILCEILTRYPPVMDWMDWSEASRARQLEAAVQRLKECGADPELAGLAIQCLANAPEDRPASASVVAERVAQFQANVEARLRAAERDRAAAEAKAEGERRRRRMVLVAAGLLLAVLAAGVAGTTVGFYQAAEARDAESKRADGETKARASEKEQRLSAEQARNDARRALESALDALDVTTSSITGDALATQPALTAEQRKFLESVLPAYRQLAEESGTDEKSRERVARAAARLGDIEYRFGRFEQAFQAWNASTRQWESLAADYQDNLMYRRHLAAAYSGVGIAHDMLGNLPEAEAAARRSLEIRKKTAEGPPNVQEYHWELAWAYNNLSAIMSKLGRSKEELQLCEECHKLRFSLANAFPNNAGYMYELAASNRNLALLHLAANRREEAEKCLVFAVQRLGVLARQSPEDARFSSELAASQSSLAVVRLDQGKPEEAKDLYQRAIGRYAALSKRFPSEPDHLRGLALAHNNFGMFFEKQSLTARAEEQFRDSLKYREELVKKSPNVPSYRQELARTLDSMGGFYRTCTKYEEAEREFQKSHSIRKQLVESNGNVVAYRTELSLSHLALGALNDSRKRPAEAEQHYRDAMAILQQLVDQHPALIDNHRFLASAKTSLGGVLVKSGDHAAAHPLLVEARATCQAFMKRSPPVVDTHVDFARACNALGKAALSSGEAIEGLGFHEEAIFALGELAESNRKFANVLSALRSSYQGRANCRLKAGQVTEAVAELDQVVHGFCDKAEHWFDFACVYADASSLATDGRLKEACASQAVGLLRKAVDAGFRDAAKLESHEKLKALRERPDYREVLASLRKPETK